jgi:hypothetical protein
MMRTGAILGSALTGAAVGALLTLSGKEKNQVTNYFSGFRGNMTDYISQFSDKISEWKGMIPGLQQEVQNSVPLKSNTSHVGRRARA